MGTGGSTESNGFMVQERGADSSADRAVIADSEESPDAICGLSSETAMVPDLLRVEHEPN